MENLFRTLRANEIDARVGTVKEKGISLLLYKDARCDQNILDETVGPYNWQRSHSRDNANCVVSLWDEKKKQWISKEDTGTESNTEKEKGLASDSFKRACFNWGIGRELYSAPFIWISGKGEDLKYNKYEVLEIDYDQNREINKLAIADAKTGVVVFTLNSDLKYKQVPELKKEPEQQRLGMDAWKAAHQPMGFDPLAALTKKAAELGMQIEVFNKCRSSLVKTEKIPYLKNQELTQKDVDEIGKAIQEYILDGKEIEA